MSHKVDIAVEKKEISEVVRNSIGWAATKDKDLLFSCFAHDADLFWFSPDDGGTIQGFTAFVDLTEGFFMRDEFRHVDFTIRELQISLSETGAVAWYHARLDDHNEWNGRPANWEDVRWTGVLEEPEGKWVIVQMHFSEASDEG